MTVGGSADAHALRSELGTELGSDVRALAPVGGGDINDAYCATLADGRRAFVKANARAPAGLFAAEAAGLAWLACDALRTPGVLGHGDRWLALEWLDLAGRPDANAFGRALAALHHLGAPAFGHGATSFLATIPLDNTSESDWPTFYVERRLRPICRAAHLDVDRELDRLRARPELFGPAEPPARLHGDLWWGNVGAVRGQAVIFDPAVYAGHREIDLAMLALFGDLPPALLDGYQQVTPLADGWRERLALHQLLPLAAHALLFGGGYGDRVRAGLATITRGSPA